MHPHKSTLYNMNETDKFAPNRAHPDAFGRSVLKISIAQLCESVGFDLIKQSALEALTNVAIRYINDLGKSANSYANLAGRSESNVFDIIKGLEDLNSSFGFLGESEVKECAVNFGVIKEISRFVGLAEDKDIPFAHPIPRFPVIKTTRLIPSFSEMGENSINKNVPPWLPAFPDAHTYMNSPVWNERKTDIRIDKGEQARQRRKAERSLLNLQQRLLFNGLAGSSSSGHCQVVDDDDDDEEEENPYVGSALPPGEKDVSMVALPTKIVSQGDRKPKSVRETFGPVIDALKGGGLDLDPMDVDRKVVSERRPVIHFKLKAGKKMLVEDLDVHLRSKGNDRRGSWFPRDDEKDDKKRRVELILRQSMEYNQEHSQM